MLGKLNHVAIAVTNPDEAAEVYRALGAVVSGTADQPDHGVTVVFIELPNAKIELLRPLRQFSDPGFSGEKPSGGMHHVCYEVPDILVARDILRKQGVRVLGDGEPKIGAHGKPVLFAHPKDFSGVLVEIEEVAGSAHGACFRHHGLSGHLVAGCLHGSALGRQSVGFRRRRGPGATPPARRLTPSLAENRCYDGGFRPSLARRLLDYRVSA